jgi:putative transposase
MARITARVTDRRRDWAEKVSTSLVMDHDLIVFEQLNAKGMVRKPKPDPDQAGAFLPNRARAKARQQVAATVRACRGEHRATWRPAPGG